MEALVRAKAVSRSALPPQSKIANWLANRQTKSRGLAFKRSAALWATATGFRRESMSDLEAS